MCAVIWKKNQGGNKQEWWEWELRKDTEKAASKIQKMIQL